MWRRDAGAAWGSHPQCKSKREPELCGANLSLSLEDLAEISLIWTICTVLDPKCGQVGE